MEMDEIWRAYLDEIRQAYLMNKILKKPTEVRGCRRFDSSLFLIHMLEPGDRLDLVRKPENPRDGSAVLVLTSRGRMPIGYIARETAVWLSGCLDNRQLWHAEFESISQCRHQPVCIVRSIRANQPE